MRRQEAAVELHALDDDHFGIGRLAFLDGDDAVGGADLLHGLGELGADFAVVVRGDGGDFGDFLLVLVVDLLGEAVQFLDDARDGLLNAAGQAPWGRCRRRYS